MKNNRKRLLLSVGVILSVMTLISIFAFRQEAQTNPLNQDEKEARIQQQIKQNGDPVADFNQQETGDERSRRLRDARSKHPKWNAQGISEVQKHGVNEKSPEFLFGGPSFNLRPQPAFSIKQSTFIVTGAITKANAYLSDDKFFVYSEFEFDVENVLKQDNNLAPLNSQTTIVLNRFGGKIRLPSGKILHRGMTAHPLPKLGKRYLFLLTYNVTIESFYINTAYELKDRKVFPIDGKDREGNYLRQYESYKQYEGMDEGRFIEEVRKALVSSTNNQKGEVVR